MRWSRRKKPNSLASPKRASLLPSWLIRFKKLGISSADGSVSSDAAGNQTVKVIPSVGRSGTPDRFSGGGGLELSPGDRSSWKEKVDGALQEPGESKNFNQMDSRVQMMHEVQRRGRSLTDLKTPRHSAGSLQENSFSAMDFKEFNKFLPELFSGEEQVAELKAEDLETERRRKTIYLSGGSPKRRAVQRQSCRVRIHSPRSTGKTEMSGLRTDEQTSRLKHKSKKKAKEKGSGLERFAVVKCSFNPQQDFRDSMIDMILERRIKKPKELEELLACYLMLNSDEYHNVIIGVFRQLWLELNQACFCAYYPAELATGEG
ncbi:hypothetical protein SAY86_011880 [Trapa natans]|uniref:Transcription repressor n=1 Tax=Trapa natans TaxID=22666 RepID=A0AAN7LVU9_TRANT|nr:hypothetical protein SAY86_011880 [Trapa natans]